MGRIDRFSVEYWRGNERGTPFSPDLPRLPRRPSRAFRIRSEAERVVVEDDVLATIRVDPEWVLDWLVSALPITPPVRRRVLVPALAWHLGDAHIGGAELTVVFATGVCSQRNLD